MPIPKVRTGRLAPDQEALDYYNVPVKHWTQTDWDQIDMGRLDLGLHTDPTPTGAQAADRRYAVSAGWFPGKKGGLGDDVTKDLRIHIGNEFSVFDDPGTWDKPDDARMALSEAAYQAGEMDLQAALDAVETGNGSTLVTSGTAREAVLAQMNELRNVMKDHGYDTISYKNAEEGVDAAVDAALNNPEAMAADVAELERARDLRMQAVRAERDGDYELGEQLDMEATDIEDGIEMAREDARVRAEEGNISYISLDPGNVRDANAAFQKDMIGKPDMMGSATVPFMGALAGLGATGAYIASQDPSKVADEALDSLGNLGTMIYNDAQTGAQLLQRGLTGTDIGEYGRLDEDAPTGLGQAIAKDFGEYVSGIDLNPFPGEYTVGQAMGDAGEFIDGLGLSDRTKDTLGGGALLASMIGMPKGTVTRSAPHLKRVGDADSTDALDVKIEGGDLVEAQKVDPESLIGRPFVSNMADSSAGDRSVITQIEGVDIPGVIREGGYDYSRQPRNVEEGRLWASEKGAVTGIMNAANEASALPGASGTPIMLPWGMSPAGSTDFAQFSADLGVQHAQRVLDPRTAARLDDRIRTGTGTGALGPVPGWAGLNEATPEYLTALGGKRKNVLAALDEFRDEGTLNLSQIRQAVGDAEATMGYRPAGLLRVGEIDTSRGMLDNSMHQTYSKGVPGTYMGNLNPGASILDVPSAQLRSGINLREKYGPVTGAKLPAAQGKAMQSNVIGVLDEGTIEEWIRRGVFD